MLVGLALLVWGGDALARVAAERLIARNVQAATGVVERPEVHLHDRFALPSVIRGAYDNVQVISRGIVSGPLRVDTVDSRLQDVRLPFHDVLVRDLGVMGIGRSTEQVTLLYTDLNAYLRGTGRPLELSARPNGSLSLSGRVSVLGTRVPASADVTASVAYGALRITPQRIQTGAATLTGAERLLLEQRFTLTVPLGVLPFGQDLTEVTVSGDGLRARAEGRVVIVRP